MLALLCVLGMLVGACGRSDHQADTGTTSTPPSSSSTGPAATGAFGTTGVICKPGKPAGSPAQGVTPRAIEIGTMADPGFAGRPGLDQELFDAATVFSKWCNAAGGINGRQIKIDLLDSALTNVKARMTEACARDFMLVGGGAVFDQDGVRSRLECLLPEVSAYSVSAEASNADLLVQPIPSSSNVEAVGDYRYLARKFPDAIKAYGTLTGDLSTTKVTAARIDEALKGLGWKRVYDDVYPAAGVADWTPFAQKIKDSGVKALAWTGEPENLAKLMQALQDIGYQLDFVRAETNHYDGKLIDTGGSALKNVYIRTGFTPFENAKPGDPTQQYLDLFDRYLPNGKKRALLGMQAWSAWLLWATAADQCGNQLTRTCVYEHASSIAEWTGGGLHAPTDPASRQPSTCVAELVASPAGFKLVADLHPNQGIYWCDKKNTYKLTGDYGQGVTLADVGKSMSQLK